MLQYAPPSGYYDLPFTWVYDANALTDGRDYLNQAVYLQGGYGDFILRRVVGLSQVLGTSGLFRLYDGQQRPLQAEPVFVNSAPTGLDAVPLDLGICKEVKYPELGQIRFDLFGIAKDAAPAAMIAFQGVRRMKGTLPERSAKFRPKTYAYQTSVEVSSAQPTAILRQKVNNYDFELFEIRVLVDGVPVAPGDDPAVTLWIRDQNREAISSLPVLDVFVDGNPNGKYQNGAIVPPLYYVKDSQVQIDVALAGA